MTNEDLPKALCVISDMEIDRYIRLEGLDFVKTMRLKFKQAGYTTPDIYLWNVAARNDTFLSQSEGVYFVSGHSASVFKQICNNMSGITAYEFMIKVLNDKAYEKVKI